MPWNRWNRANRAVSSPVSGYRGNAAFLKKADGGCQRIKIFSSTVFVQ